MRMTREEAIKIIDCYDIGFYDLSGEKIPADKLADAFDMAIEALEADTVEVVRCKDCKHWNDWGLGAGTCERSENGYFWYGTDFDDFCSFGERREE